MENLKLHFGQKVKLSSIIHWIIWLITKPTDITNYFKIVGAVLLDFSAAFDIIDHSLLLEKLVLWLYIPCYNVDKELPVL